MTHTEAPTVSKELFFSHFTSLLQQDGQNEALLRYRLEAWKRLQALGLPEAKSDAYQYIKLGPVLEASYSTPKEGPLTPQPLVETSGSYIVFMNGTLRLDLSSLDALPASCVARSFRDGFKTYATLLGNTFSQGIKNENDFFTLLNMACYQDGLLLYIPPKVVLEKPIEIIHLFGPGSSGGAVLPRVLLFMGKASEATVAVSSQVAGADKMIASMLFETCLEEDAHLKVIETLTEAQAQSGMIFSALRSTLKGSASLQSVQIRNGNIPVRFDTKVVLRGEAAETQLNGLWITSGCQECHTNIVIEHEAVHTHSSQLFKGVLFDRSRSSFQGKIHVHQEAQKTQAYQLNNNLVLSDEAQANSKPNLEIFADDVKASHGATVGQLDEEQLFYLKTRGFSQSAAKMALIQGFCEQIADKITIVSLKDRVEKMIACAIN